MLSWMKGTILVLIVLVVAFIGFMIYQTQKDKRVSNQEGPVYVTNYLEGGLGNQMFQVAHGYALARKYNKIFVMDRSVTKVFENRDVYWDTVFQPVKDFPTSKPKFEEVSESGFAYEEKPEPVTSTQYKGYFQSPLYFNEYREEIIDIFTRGRIETIKLSDDPKEDYKCPTVSLHVRRTDYVQHSDFHTNQGSDYYKNAIQAIQEKLDVNRLEIIVFSDDPEWCRQNLVSEFEPHLVSVKDLGKDYEDLYRMTLCEHHIIANSSFSWWGSYLDRKGGFTVAPQKWFEDESTDWSTIYMPDWIII